MPQPADYQIDASPDRAVLSGILRLPSPESYDAVLAPVKEAMRAAPEYAIDVSDVTFMNSSGIRALAGLVLEARRSARTLRLIGRRSVPWHRKTAGSLQALYEQLDVSLS